VDNIIITGVSGGIGKACAEKLMKDGSTIIGIDRETSEIKEQFRDYGDQFCAYDCDLMDMEQLENLMKTIVAENGPAGGLIHCAGFDKMAPIHMVKVEDMEALWRIHALVPMRMISILSKKKNHADGMSIVLITSQSAHEGAMGHTAYAAAKGAIEGYLAPAAAELMEKGIRINMACFAPIRTNMAKGWMDKLTPEGMEQLMKSYPLGIGEVSDASNLICFLMRPESRYINGQIMIADGGHTVRKV